MEFKSSPAKKDKIPLYFIENGIPTFEDYLEMVKKGFDIEKARTLIKRVENQNKKLGKDFSKTVKTSAENALRERYEAFLKRVGEIKSGEKKREEFKTERGRKKAVLELTSKEIDLVKKVKAGGNPNFNYRKLTPERREKFDRFFKDMFITTVSALVSGRYDEMFSFSDETLPNSIFEGGDSANLGNVISAVKVVILKNVLEVSSQKMKQKIEGVLNNNDIPTEDKQPIINEIIEDFEDEEGGVIIDMTPDERIELLRQELEGNTDIFLSNRQNSTRYDEVLDAEKDDTFIEMEERVVENQDRFTWLRIALGLGAVSTDNPVVMEEVFNKLPDDFNREAFNLFNANARNTVIPTAISDPDTILPSFWTNTKIAAVGGLVALLASYGIYKYFEKPDENLDAVISDEEFEVKKKEGFIPPEATKSNFVEAFNMTTPEKLEEYEKTRDFKTLIPYNANEASTVLAEKFINPFSKNYSDPLLAMVNKYTPNEWYGLINNYLNPTKYDLPEPFLFPSTSGALAPPQKIPSITELDNLNNPVIALPPLPTHQINNNYTQNSLPNIMSFQNPYKNYDDLPEYMKVYITREEFDATMKNEGNINRIFLKNQRGVDNKNGLLSTKLAKVPIDRIPVKKNNGYLRTFPVNVPNSSPISNIRPDEQGMIGTNTRLNTTGVKKFVQVEFGKGKKYDNQELIGTETRLIKKVKKIPLY